MQGWGINDDIGTRRIKNGNKMYTKTKEAETATAVGTRGYAHLSSDRVRARHQLRLCTTLGYVKIPSAGSCHHLAKSTQNTSQPRRVPFGPRKVPGRTARKVSTTVPPRLRGGPLPPSRDAKYKNRVPQNDGREDRNTAAPYLRAANADGDFSALNVEEQSSEGKSHGSP